MSLALPLSTAPTWALPANPEFIRAAALAMPGLQLFSDAVRLPFEVMRSQHAEAVRAGLMARSILESRDFENRIDALEHICLGPFARSV